ncbi:MAG TPA: V-type ATPase 116kDa subunit family protein [Clostridia bacterium]
MEKLKYVSIIGPVGKFDQFVLKHIIDRDMQLEHALTHMRNIRGLKPFMDENPYDSLVKELENTNKHINVRVSACPRNELSMLAKQPVDPEKISEYLDSLEKRIISHKIETENISRIINENMQILKQLIPIRTLQFDIGELFRLEYIKFRFGKMPRESYKRLDVLAENLDIVVVPFASDDHDVWVSYFVPSVNAEKADSIMFSLYFERVRLSERFKGLPAEAVQSIEKEIEQLEHEMRRSEKAYEELIFNEKEKFQKIYNHVVYLHRAFDVRKFSAHNKQMFFIAGWTTKDAYKQLTDELKGRKDITVSVEDPGEVREIKPPTILKNNRFFKPFENIVIMYGIPAHNEFDPTILAAITFILMFGAMFGDVGQGSILAAAGLFMFYKSKSSLGWVLACVGVSSIAFGFLYGSVFGIEDIIKALWKAPMDNMNQLLIMSIAFGAVIILLSIIINIINSIKAKDYGRLFFDKNGLAGLIFYAGAIGLAVYSYFEGRIKASAVFVVLFLVVPPLLMFFKGRLERLFVKHGRQDSEGGFAEAFFEVFEAVLGFLSNTISFVRVGAFALSHAGLSLAFRTLYDMTGGAAGIIVMIIGNILIIGLEGLIVAIQCLRLQYFEMFGRFFSGDGYEFKPIRICGKNEG